ncbi:MAG: ExeA family protein [Planctomycetota bacterium]|jgi:type II secretory pathway predicted ATPase ExeA
MYEAHWNLSRKPFRNDLDLSFAFMWEAYEEALARLQYFVADGKRLALLKGPSGVGKSYLLAALERDVRLRGDIVATVPNPSLPPADLLEYILTLYGHDRTGLSKARSLALLTQFARENALQNTRTYLLVDEAQAIRDPLTLDEINLILNLAEGPTPLFCVILAGEPQISDLLNDCPGLRQKIEIGAQLTPLVPEETAQYVAHRLGVVGGSGVFEDAAIEKLHEWSGGIARLINIGADLAMLAAFGEEKQTVDVASVTSGLEEIETRFGGGNTAADSRK